MSDKEIFRHRDEDGDAIKVVPWAGADRPSLILTNESNRDDEMVSVRLYPGEVRGLTQALGKWLSAHSDEPVVFRTQDPASVRQETVPEPTEVPVFDPDWSTPSPVRLEALRLAVQRCYPGVHQDTVVVVAREFEKYLRGDDERAQPAITCPMCGHPQHPQQICGRGAWEDGVRHPCLCEAFIR